MKKLILIVITIALSACGAKIGSEEWCQEMNQKERNEWIAEETKLLNTSLLNPSFPC